MITEIPAARNYFLKSLIDTQEPMLITGDNPQETMEIMEFVGGRMNDDMIEAQSFVGGTNCHLYVNISTIEIIDLLDKANKARSKYMKAKK